MILVFGRTGQVGQALAQQSVRVVCLGRDAADLATPGACAAAIAAHGPEAVINAAGFTAVDLAEAQEPLATRINGAAAGEIARACAGRGIPLVHISSDYVFAGTGSRAWRPEDPVGPLNAYGRSKVAGEAAVRAAGGTYAILRTSWVFGATGANFVRTMLHLAREGRRLTVVEDQVGGPTPASALAATCLRIAERLVREPALCGTYHFAGAPDVSWKTFAEAIFRAAGREVAVTGIPSSGYPSPALRPANSRLDCTSTLRVFGLNRPHWPDHLAHILAELGETRT